MGNGEREISKVTWIMMLAVALFYDGIQALADLLVIGLFVDTFIDIFAWLTFYVWLKTYNMNFASLKRGGPLMGAGFIELIPGLNILPDWTVAIVIMWLTTEGVKKVSEISPVAGQMAGMALQAAAQKSPTAVAKNPAAMAKKPPPLPQVKAYATRDRQLERQRLRPAALPYAPKENPPEAPRPFQRAIPADGGKTADSVKKPSQIVPPPEKQKIPSQPVIGRPIWISAEEETGE